MRPHRLDHHGHEHLGQLFLAAAADEPEPFGDAEIAADRLAVHTHQPFDRPEPSPDSQRRSTSRTSYTRTSRNAIAAPSVAADRDAAIAPSAAPTLGDPGRWSHHWRRA